MNSPTELADRAPRVLVVDADCATLELLEEWLAADGCRVVAETEPFDLAIVDVPYPREGGLDRLRGLTAGHPGTPIVALSATFFGSVACSGGCARALGVAGVLPKPVAQGALIATVRRLLAPP